MNILTFAMFAEDCYRLKRKYISDAVIWDNHRLVKNKGREVRVWEFAHCYVVAFAGTDPGDARDLIADAKARLHSPPVTRRSGRVIRQMQEVGALVHHGAWGVSEMIPNLLMVLSDQAKPIVVVGHSLGDLRGECFAMLAMDAGRSVPLVVGFGPPRTGNKQFTKLLRSLTVLITVSNWKDPIVHLAPQKMGYEGEPHLHLDPIKGKVWRRDPDLYQGSGLAQWLSVWFAIKHFKLSHSMESYISSIVMLESKECFREGLRALIAENETLLTNKNIAVNTRQYITV